MAGRQDGLIKGFKASGAIPARRFVKFGADDRTVTLATAATDPVIGTSSDIDVADGEPCDVHLGGLAEVVYGGNVTRGASLLTAAAGGEAVAAAPAAGVNNRIAGVAMVSGVDNDVGLVLLAPGQIQGA
ncbi:MAG: hypothetical protein QOI38_3133 [Sphingomonadales bacterium]|jgi:hypothetical protein|nr:hypothetical protein [Sphingomonadales bacterium]